MKFMMGHSWGRRWPCKRVGGTMTSEQTTHTRDFRFAAPTGTAQPTRSYPMSWSKPQATDLRYGFEITMYISAR